MNKVTELITTPKLVEMTNPFFKPDLLRGKNKKKRNMMNLKEIQVLGKMPLTKKTEKDHPCI